MTRKDIEEVFGDVDTSDTESPDLRRLVRPQTHESDIFLNINQFGLDPWFACDRVIKENDGHAVGTFENNDGHWKVRLNYEDSNIVPVSVTPAGTRINIDTREYRLTAVLQDGPEKKRVSAHISPRWQNMEGERDSGRKVDIKIPHTLVGEDTDAVAIRIQGSNINIHPDTLIPLLKQGANAVGLNGGYFSENALHETSTFNDIAAYVRIHENESGPVHARSGPLVQLGHLLENDRSGYRKMVQNDTDKQHASKPGYYHTTTLGATRVQEAFGADHSFPREMKHYYIDDYHKRDDDDPLRHPKLEVAYQRSRWNETLHYNRKTVDRVYQELKETIYAILNDAGINLRADVGPYVEDSYFEPENHTFNGNVIELDLAAIKHKQESVVFKHVVDGFSPVEQEALETLVTDGGEVSPGDIAEENDRHPDSVRRALRRIDDLLDRAYGQVSLSSNHVADLIHDKIQLAKDASKTALETMANAEQAAERGLKQSVAAFEAWASAHVEDLDRKGGGLRIDLGTYETAPDRDKIKRLLREGLRYWKEAYQDPEPFRNADARYTVSTPVDTTSHYLDVRSFLG